MFPKALAFCCCQRFQQMRVTRNRNRRIGYSSQKKSFLEWSWKKSGHRPIRKFRMCPNILRNSNRHFSRTNKLQHVWIECWGHDCRNHGNMNIKQLRKSWKTWAKSFCKPDKISLINNNKNKTSNWATPDNKSNCFSTSITRGIAPALTKKLPAILSINTTP